MQHDLTIILKETLKKSFILKSLPVL